MGIDKTSLEAFKVAFNDWDDNNRSMEYYEEYSEKLEEIYEVLGKLAEETEQDKFVCESCGSSEVRETVFRWLNGKEVIEDMGRVFGDVWCEVCDAESEVIAEDKFKKEVINNE